MNHILLSIRNWSIVAVLGVLLSACGHNPELDDELTEQQLYEKARKALDNNSYIAAISRLESLEARFPFGRYAAQTQIDLPYAHLKNLDYAAAEAAAARFLRNFSGTEGTDYVLYIKGMANYEADQGLFSKYISTDISSRDIGAAKHALEDFYQLVSRYPDSEYAPDARARMVYLRNELAEHELHVGRYYLRREAYMAAAERGRYVLFNFQGTPSIKGALKLLQASYQALGDDAKAQQFQGLYQQHFGDEA